MKEKLKQVNEYEWLINRDERKGMNVDARLIANKKIMDVMEEEAIMQLTNVAMLPGVIDPVWAMPDAHVGYGLPMGAVAAFDKEKGVISSGMTGFDINCGINMLRTNLKYNDVKDKMKDLIPALFSNIPCGVGSKGKLKLNNDLLDEVLSKGVDWAIKNGYGVKDDKKHLEEEGRMDGDPSKVSDLAKKRGLQQLGTLGAGNHFLEIQKVVGILDEDTAKKWGLFKDQAVIMVHCGSRGFGHQVATDYLKIHERAAEKYGIKLPDRQLACAPANSEEGQDYFKAMQAAVNYAFANRLVISHWIRETFESIFDDTWSNLGMSTIYGIAHNVCKLEKVGNKELYIHRKGATRSYPDIPVLIAGSMGTASYILKGTNEAKKTFYSTCHGAGRAMSRSKAIRSFRGEEIKRKLESQGKVIKATGWKVLAEESPDAYKNVEDVVDSVHNAKISTKVARMVPIGVIKG